MNSNQDSYSFEQLSAYRERMESEVEQARQLQMLLLPNKTALQNIQTSHSIAISNFFQPSTSLAGDSWDVLTIDENRIAFYMSDFTGHGVGAAIQSFRLHMLIAQASKHYSNPSALLDHLNTKLKQMLSTEIFCTFFYGVIDVEASILSYASAGAPCPFLYRHASNDCEALHHSGLPLGISLQMQYPTHQVSMQRGDTLCLYSDALLETPSAQNPFITESQLKRKLTETMSKASDVAQRQFMRRLLTKIGALDGTQFEDDLTITLITRLANQP